MTEYVAQFSQIVTENGNEFLISWKIHSKSHSPYRSKTHFSRSRPSSKFRWRFSFRFICFSTSFFRRDICGNETKSTIVATKLMTPASKGSLPLLHAWSATEQFPIDFWRWIFHAKVWARAANDSLPVLFRTIESFVRKRKIRINFHYLQLHFGMGYHTPHR